MLVNLNFTNFKSWETAPVRCRRITGLFGRNSSGKTSILQFLLLLKQTKNATDRKSTLELNGDILQLGTIIDAIHAHEENRTINVELSFEMDNELTLEDPSQRRSSFVTRGNELTLRAEIGIHNRAPFARSISYSLGDMQFRLHKKPNSSEYDLKADAVTGRGNSFRFVRNPGRPWQLPGPIKAYAFPDQARTYYQNAGFLADLEVRYESFIDRIYYLGPLRDFPQRDYLWARTRPSDVGMKGEKTIDAILAATEDRETRKIGLRSRKKIPFQHIIAHWLRQMGLISDFRVEEIRKGSNRWQVRIKTKPGASEVLLTDVGFGVSQVLPVLTLLQYVPEGSIVILEQPEIHLHPLAQAELADAILNAAFQRGVQVILESHSEHLLLRLQRRIAENAVVPESVQLYFCDAPEGVSKLEALELDLYGQIRNWPKNFMGNAFEETAQTELARLKRMKAAE